MPPTPMFPRMVELRNGTALVIREADGSDAATLLDYLEVVSGQSDFLSFGPGEFNRTEETVLNLRQKAGIQLPEDATACLRALLSDPDPWLQTCALFLIATEANDSCNDFVKPLLESPEFMVRQTAALTVKKTS